MNKPYQPRQHTFDAKLPLDQCVQRDKDAVVLPLSMIILTSNIREKVDGIKELGASIRQHGLLQPLVVRKNGEKFELIAGHRRYLALNEIEYAEAPCRIQNATQEDTHILKLIENINRENLSGWDTCRAVVNLLHFFDNNQTRLAQAIQKDRTYVSHALAVMNSNIECERVHTMSLRDLFKLACKKKRQGDNGPPTSPAPPKPKKILSFKDDKEKGWSLRLDYHPNTTSKGEKLKIIDVLEGLVNRLKSEGLSAD